MRAGRPSLTGALILLVWTLPAAAHELGAIRTTARFQRSGRYAVELIVDREHLPPGFAARPVGDLARGTRIAFDGRPDPPRTVVRPDGAETVIILSGRIPAGARTFTWSNPVRLGTYLLTLETEGQPGADRQWLENGEESRPFALAASIVPPARIPVVRQYHLGVETGQLTVIGIALALFGLPFRRKPWYRSRIAVPASIAIAAVGFYWSVERVLLR